jgi:hypothetical protein
MDLRDIARINLDACTDSQRSAVRAVLEHGSFAGAARALKKDRMVVRRAVMRAAGAAPLVPVGGTVKIAQPNVPERPADARVRRYILTCAQNNTHVHRAFFENLEAYAAHLGAEIMVARFSYNKAAYGKQSTKAGREPTAADQELWYDPAIDPYVCDDPARHGSCRWRLAPTILWCAEMNIQPTAVRPLSGLDAYAGESSGVFPHAKIGLESVPVAAGREPKFNYTTGACTERNYIQKKEGIKAEFHHAYGALLVEVDCVTGDWWARHLNATNDGTFYDLTRRVENGKVTFGHRLEAINWGDVHASEIDPDVREANWRAGGILDVLRPRHQFLHDLFSMRSRSHHEAKSFEARLVKAVAGRELDTVEGEVETTAELVRFAARWWCKTLVVCSNHDRHGERWLDEADYKQDLPNARYFLEAQLARVDAIHEARPWSFLPWALRRAGILFEAQFLERDESFVICGPAHPVECGYHGDEGPNGARGNTGNLLKLSVRINKGHDHSATIRDGVVSAGVCARRMNYCHGPSSWSVSHIGTYANGKRVILTFRNGRCWL